MPGTGEQRVRRIETKAKDHLARSVKMKEMRDQGYSNVAIANRMGVSESTVRRVLQQCDIRRG